jgi:branched-chain amino acid transport system permease protein
MRSLLKQINGPQTVGNGLLFWIAFLCVLAIAAAYPAFADPYDIGNFAYFFLWIFMALGLCLIWGYGGMLSFGQTFFFGLGGYGYGVLAINLGGDGGTTFLALLLAVGVAGLAATVLGYFLIYGRIGGVFFGIVTLSVTLALAVFLGQTAGPEWRIGKARLNGFNGMQGMEPLNLPLPGGDTLYFEGPVLYYFLLALLLATYLGLRVLVNSRFGNVLVAVRENPLRAELLGYDTRRYQIAAFVLGSALAGLSGALYTSWGMFITPSSIGLPAAAMPIVWVAFSGRSDLTAVLIGSFLLLLMFQTITVYSQQAALVLMGLLLLLTVMFSPQGFVIGVARAVGRLRHWRGRATRPRRKAA